MTKNSSCSNRLLSSDKHYDYLVVGAGLFGAVFAHEAKKKGKSCLMVERRPHIAGNVYTESVEGIEVHRYGAHIFHTSDKEIWDYVNQFASFNHFVNSPIAYYKGNLYNLPFNMNTFHAIWNDVLTPEQAKTRIEKQRKEAGIVNPANLEEQAISLVGKDIYYKLIKGYTEKQWGRDCKDLPASFFRRLPVRLTFDNNYFNDRWQGIPETGYTSMVQKMLVGVEIKLNTDYLEHRDELSSLCEKIVYTGPIDEYFNYTLGALHYRKVCFETEILDTDNFQGVAVVNYTEREIPYTRIIEHKHFAFGQQPKTVISREYPSEWKVGDDPYYPVNDAQNAALYLDYRKLADAQDKVIFGGRLGQYEYFDMDKVIVEALKLVQQEFKDYA